MPEKQVETKKPVGKIVNIETLFPEWNDDENWTEPLAPEKIPNITYPGTLNVASQSNINQFFSLVSDEPVDPKKKKDTKPAKGKGPTEVVELTEQLVNEDGKPLPVVYRDNGQEDFKEYPALRAFAMRPKEQLDPLSELDQTLDQPTSDAPLDFVDPLICETFNIIAEFMPKIIKNTAEKPANVQEMHCNYLWRAVYPQIKTNQKPVYNPAGKYAVKLFLAGKWRKVYVDDSLPVNSKGQLAVAHSVDTLELWPILLSKAIYTMYTACLYTFGDKAPSDLLPIFRSSPGQQTCQFISFAVYALTSWHPHHSADATSLFLSEKSKSAKLISNMILAGIPCVHRDNIITKEDELLFKFKEGGGGGAEESKEVSVGEQEAAEQKSSPSVLPVASTADEPLSATILKTKRQFKEEYLQRRQIREQIVSSIQNRESKIDIISSQIDSSKREIFCISQFNLSKGRYDFMPILAISLPD
ncbi:hypothetical protein EON64_16370, partial [archaeon]